MIIVFTNQPCYTKLQLEQTHLASPKLFVKTVWLYLRTFNTIASKNVARKACLSFFVHLPLIAGEVISQSELLRNPIVGLMLGILATGIHYARNNIHNNIPNRNRSFVLLVDSLICVQKKICCCITFLKICPNTWEASPISEYRIHVTT